jgi:hypothetical protein
MLEETITGQGENHLVFALFFSASPIFCELENAFPQQKLADLAELADSPVVSPERQ